MNVTVAAETPGMLALAATDDLVAGVVGWTDLTAPDIADTLSSLRELPGGEHLVGMRHQVREEPDPQWIRRTDVLRGLTVVADAGLAYDLLVLPHQPPAATAAAARFPDLTFVLDHAAKPPVASGATEPWASRIRAFAALPNTVCQLSGLVTGLPAAPYRSATRTEADSVSAPDAAAPSRERRRHRTGSTAPERHITRVGRPQHPVDARARQ